VLTVFGLEYWLTILATFGLEYVSFL